MWTDLAFEDKKFNWKFVEFVVRFNRKVRKDLRKVC